MTQNPLLNPLIIENVFVWMDRSQLLPLSDLKNFRLVCKVWQFETTRLWRQSATLKIVQNEQLGNGVGMPLGKFMECFEFDTYEFRSKPFANYKLSGCTIDASTHTEFFWENIGPIMKYLHLDNCKVTVANNIAEKIFFVYTPRLNSLVLTDNTFFGRSTRNTEVIESGHNLKCLEVKSDISRSGLSWDDILKRYPNLEKLVLEKPTHLDAIDESLQSPNVTFLKNLKELEICTPAGAYLHLYNFFTRNPPIESMSLFIPRRNFRNRNFNIQAELLEVGETLRVLRVTSLSRGVIYRGEPFDEVFLPNLKELHLFGNVVCSLEFVKLFPSLEILRINISMFEKRQDLQRYENSLEPEARERHRDMLAERRNGPCDIVRLAEIHGGMENVVMQNLTHFRYDNALSVFNLQLIRKWMPHLKRLETILNNETLEYVSELWPNLEHLSCLYGSDIDDLGGLTPKGEKKFFVHLRYLRTFRLESYCNSGKLTDSCVDVFLAMESLSGVEISVSRLFTRGAEQKLKDNIQFVRVIRNYGKLHSFCGYECCQRIDFMLDYQHYGFLPLHTIEAFQKLRGDGHSCEGFKMFKKSCENGKSKKCEIM